MPDPWSLGIGLGSTLLGGLGSLFGTQDTSPRQDEIYEMLKKRAGQGIDPKLVEQMRRNLRMQLGAEFSGLSAQRYNQMRRQNAPRVIQEQIMDQLAKARGGALQQGLMGIEGLSEQARQGALGQMASIFGMMGSPTGEGFGQLFGAGLTGLMNQPQRGNSWVDEELQKLYKRYQT